jgi:hypothetical protein
MLSPVKIVDHRIKLSHLPRVKDLFLRYVIIQAFVCANHSHRQTYTLVFHDNNRTSLQPGLRELDPIYKDGCDAVEDTVGKRSVCLELTPEEQSYRFGYHFPVKVLFLRHDRLEYYQWKNVETFPYALPDVVLLNPRLLDKFETARTSEERVRLAMIIYCVILHELAHHLYFKIYKAVETCFCPDYNPQEHLEYGTEVEYRIFGGRILCTEDFTAMRLETRDGQLYDLDPLYFYTSFLLSQNPSIEFEKLARVNDISPLVTGRNWLSVGELNGTHIK